MRMHRRTLKRADKMTADIEKAIDGFKEANDALTEEIKKLLEQIYSSEKQQRTEVR